jgi:ATP-dependent Clp protease adaptor protein ClpS
MTTETFNKHNNVYAAAEPPQLPAVIEMPERTLHPESTELMEALFRVLLHNDDVTPFDYVMNILAKVFMLSSEISEHVALTAHDEGIAIVVIKPRNEAERLSHSANRMARADGFPLTFTTEPEF